MEESHFLVSVFGIASVGDLCSGRGRLGRLGAWAFDMNQKQIYDNEEHQKREQNEYRFLSMEINWNTGEHYHRC